MRKKSTTQFLALLLLLGLSTSACAHPGHASTGLVSGLLHPCSGMDHLLAMLAVGLWAAQYDGHRMWLLPTSFMSMLAFGASTAQFYPGLPLIESGIAASVLISGLLIARSASLGLLVSGCLTAMFGLFHGYAHGVEMPDAMDPAGYALGFLATTALLHLIGISLGKFARGHSAHLARSLGIVIAASGAWMLAMN